MPEFLRFKKSNCKNCYKCIRHCPVKSIKFTGEQANIVNNECILCGQCFVVCPQNAKEIKSELEKVKVMLCENKEVYVSLAPSFIANYEGVGIEQMEKALKQLGFFQVEETAIGATIVKKQYEEMLKSGEQNVLISSCCHSINLLIQKYFPHLLKHIANIKSQMKTEMIYYTIARENNIAPTNEMLTNEKESLISIRSLLGNTSRENLYEKIISILPNSTTALSLAAHT